MIRGVIEEAEVTCQLQLAAARYPRAWDAWHAFTWIIARTPGIGLQISRIPPPWYLYRQDGVAGIGAPGFIASYSFDDLNVTVHAVRVV
jgi:hypothetical protein